MTQRLVFCSIKVDSFLARRVWARKTSDVMQSKTSRLSSVLPFRRLAQLLRKATTVAKNAAQLVNNPPYSLRYPTATREALALFGSAIDKLPESDAALTKKLRSIVFDSYLWTIRTRRRSIFEVLDTLRTIAATTRSTPKLQRSAGEPSTNLNILFVTSMFPGAEHGGGLRVFDMMTELADRGHRVSLYSPEDFKGTTKTLDLVKGKLASYRIVKPGFFTPTDFAAWLSREAVHYDAIHYVWPHSSALMPAGRSWTKTSVFELIESCSRRCLMDLERFLAAGNAREVENASFSLLMNWKLEHDAISSADRVIALTDADASFTSHLFDVASVDVIPQGISKTFVLDRVNETGDNAPTFGEQSAVFIGNYNHYPNKDGLLWFLNHVHPKILAQLPSFKLIVAGAGDISSVKEKLDTTPAVTFLGEVEDLVNTLQSGKICIAPLISGAGIRGKVNQYSVVRRPTVSTRIGACGTPYRHEESIMIADDPNEFAQHVVKLLTDTKLYEKIRSNASDVALEHFSWAPLIKNLEAIYAE